MKTWYDFIKKQIISLIDSFKLFLQKELVLGIYNLICRESLNVPLGTQFKRFSKINNDGTPFQFSVSIGSNNGGLRFLGEVGRSGDTVIQRKEKSYQKLKEILRRLKMRGNERSLTTFLNDTLPNENINFTSNSAGAIWIGSRFQQGKLPLLKIYTNLKWGEIDSRKRHFFRILKQYGFSKSWSTRIEHILYKVNKDWNPLGAAITLGSEGILETTLYMRSYERSPIIYEKMMQELGVDFDMGLFKKFTSELIGNRIGFRSGSLVTSFGMSKELNSLKIEACGHCYFSSDWIGKKICMKLLNEANLNNYDYEMLLNVLCKGNLSKSETNYHCFIGLGLNTNAKTRINIYLKPFFRVASAAMRKYS